MDERDDQDGKDSKDEGKGEKKGKDLATMPFSHLCGLLVFLLSRSSRVCLTFCTGQDHARQGCTEEESVG